MLHDVFWCPIVPRLDPSDHIFLGKAVFNAGQFGINKTLKVVEITWHCCDFGGPGRAKRKKLSELSEEQRNENRVEHSSLNRAENQGAEFERPFQLRSLIPKQFDASRSFKTAA
jgi:hypothetical protein